MSKIALVTGASAGFGKAIVEKLVADGYKVVGAARRLEKLEELQKNLGEKWFYPLQIDLSKTESVDSALASLPKQWKAIDV